MTEIYLLILLLFLQNIWNTLKIFAVKKEAQDSFYKLKNVTIESVNDTIKHYNYNLYKVTEELGDLKKQISRIDSKLQ